MPTIETPRDRRAGGHRAAAADGTSVPSMVEQALRTLIRDRVIQQEAARDPLDPPTTRSFGRMQDVYDSYLMEGLGAPRGGH